MKWDRFDILASIASSLGILAFCHLYIMLDIVQLFAAGTILNVGWPIFRAVIADCFPETEE